MSLSVLQAMGRFAGFISSSEAARKRMIKQRGGME